MSGIHIIMLAVVISMEKATGCSDTPNQLSASKLPESFSITNSISWQSTQPFQCDILSTACGISDGVIDLAYRYESVTTVNTNPSEPIKDKVYTNLTGVYIPAFTNPSQCLPWTFKIWYLTEGQQKASGPGFGQKVLRIQDNYGEFFIKSAGYHWMKIKPTELGSTWFKILYVQSVISHVAILCMQLEFLPGEALECFLSVGQGSRMNISIRVDYSDGSRNENTFSGVDVPIVVFHSTHVRMSNLEWVPFHLPDNESRIYVFSPWQVKEAGILHSLDLYVKRTGLLTIAIVSPYCDQFFKVYPSTCYNHEKNITFSNGDGDYKYDVKQMHGFKPVKIDYVTTAHPIPTTPPDFDMKLEKLIMVYLNKTGLNRISLAYNPIEVRPGWYFGIKKTSTSALLEVTTNNSEHPCSARGTDFMIGSMLGNHEYCHDSYYPHVDWYISFRFMHAVRFSSNPPSGPVNITVLLKNQLEEMRLATKSVVIQGSMNLSFIPSQPIDASEDSYDISKEYITLGASTGNGSNVDSKQQFKFEVVNTDVSFITEEGKSTVTASLFKLGVGLHKIRLTALNTFNSPIIETEVRVISKIWVLTLSSSPDVVSSKDLFQYKVSLRGGNDVTLKIDFGDGKNNETFIKDAYSRDDFQMTGSYRFQNTCGQLEVTATATNKYSKLKKAVSISVLCPIKGVSIKTTPIANTNGIIMVSKGFNFELYVTLTSGSYPIYKINFEGENSGTEKIIDDSKSFNPDGLQQYYTYRYLKEYNITIRVKSKDDANWVVEEILHVMVTTCAAPPINFPYGSSEKPFSVSRGVDNEFTAEYKYHNDECKSIDSNLTMKWKFVYPNNSAKDIGASKRGYILSYLIKSNTLAAGRYELQLHLSFNSSDYIYYGYIELDNLGLLAEIKNGVYQTIPIYKIDDEGNLSYYEAKLSGEDSYDPEAKGDGIEKMKFIWKCRVKSDQKDINNAKKDSPDDVQFQCLTNEYETIVETKSVISLHTKQFLTNIKYEFHLIITKDDRSGNYTQLVSFVKGDTPNVNISCLNNCKEKINVFDKLSLYNNCTICPKNKRIIGHWKILRWDNEKGFVIATEINDTNIVTSLHSSNLVISSNAFLEGYKYQFELRAFYEGSENSSTIIKIERMISTLPSNGICTVSPLNGTAAETEFDFVCNGWVAQKEDRPLTYEFQYDLLDDEPNQPNRAKILNPTTPERPYLLNTKLPAGRKIDFTLRIKVKIINRFGAYETFETQRITVVPPVLDESNTEDVLKKLINDKPPDPTDVKGVADHVNSLMSIISIQRHQEKDRIGESSIDEITNLPDARKEQANSETSNEALQQRRQVRLNALTYLGDVNVTTYSEAKAISTALEVVTEESAELTEEATEKGILAVQKTTESVQSVYNDAGAEEFNSLAETLLNVLSNLLKTQDGRNEKLLGREPDMEKQKDTKESNTTDLVIKARGETNTLIELIHVVAGLQSTLLLADEEPYHADTDKFGLELLKHKVYDGNSNLNENNFRIPSFSYILGKESEALDIATIEIINFKYNIYSWDLNNSKNIKSEIVSLNIKSGTKRLEIKNTKKPMEITITNKGLETRNVSFDYPGFVKIEGVNVASDCKMVMGIRPLNDFKNETNLTVYIQYGRVPNPNDYDIKMNISNEYGIKFEKGEGIASDFEKDNAKYDMNIRRNANVQGNSKFSLTMWNFDEFTYASINHTEKKLYFVFHYHGPVAPLVLTENPYTDDIIDSRGYFNYALQTFCAKCMFFEEKSDSYKENGCEVNLNKTSLEKTCCLSNHLTSFGGFYVAPNPLPPLTIEGFKQGYALTIAVGVVLLFYLIGLIILRRYDIADKEKVGVCPLIDNKREDRYLYEITVKTGTRANAGTKSNVFFKLIGDQGDSEVRQMKDAERIPFQRSATDVFIMSTSNSLGNVGYLRIWHDNSGGDWYIRSILVIDLQTDKKSVFIADRWLAVDKEDGLIETFIPEATEEELKDFSYLFSTKTRMDLTDAHLWFSVYARPPRSPFTRCQRFSVAVTSLFCAMLASLMFYRAIPKGEPSQENQVAGFSFTWKQVYIGFISACITVPINLILVAIFRSIHPSKSELARRSQAKKDDNNDGNNSEDPQGNAAEGIEVITTGMENHAEMEQHDLNDTNHDYNENTNKKKKKKNSFTLPHWVLYPAWLLCILVMLGCAFLVIWYGISFGNKKSVEWLKSVTIALVQDILVLQPLKIFVMAMFVAVAIKQLEEEERTEAEKTALVLAKDENWLTSLGTTVFDRVHVEDLEPLDVSKVNKMRQKTLKEKRMNEITREICVYLFFTFLVLCIAFLLRDRTGFFQTRDIEELFLLKPRSSNNTKLTNFNKLVSSNDFWPWMEEKFLEEVYPTAWYNLSSKFDKQPKIKNFPGRLFLNDLNSKIVNGIRIRQVRVKKNSCTMARKVAPYLTLDCAGEYNDDNEETRDFNYNWSQPFLSKEPFSPLNSPWRYQSASQLDGYPLWAELGHYHGGGYVVDTFPKWDNKALLENLKNNTWIDRHTRAVIIEFTLFNAATNYFQSVVIVLEFPPGGGSIPYFSITTFRLFRLSGRYEMFSLACEIGFLLMTLLLIIREVKIIKREKCSYFKKFWNLVEISNIILTAVAIFLYFYREYYGKQLLSRLPSKRPEKFINFQLAAYFDTSVLYVVAIICFFVILKFIKLLSFNGRISLLARTLQAAWYPLMMLSVSFVVVFMAYLFSSTIIFGIHLYGYRDTYYTIAEMFRIILGKFTFYQFENTNRIVGPLFFFSFNVMVNWIIVNLMISLLTDVYCDVRFDVLGKGDEYHIVEYFLKKLKGIIGMREVAVNTNEVLNAEPNLVESRKQSRVKKSNSFLKENYYNSPISHWTDNKDLKFLQIEEEQNQKTADETVDKFIRCLEVINGDLGSKRKKKKEGKNDLHGKKGKKKKNVKS